jgi:N-acetylmuramoyl-L-alanine amidase
MAFSLSQIKFVKSPNFGNRGGQKPQIIILHCPVGTLQSATATFLNPASKVSAHYIVDRTGDILQMVALSDAAWHAMHYPNLIGIGIEMVDRYMVGGYLTRGCMSDPQWFTEPQLQNVAELVASLMRQFNIPINKVMGHNDPYLRQFGNNHQDPGPAFPWGPFRQRVAAINIAPPPAPTASPTTMGEHLLQTKLEVPLVMTTPVNQRKPRGRRLKRKVWK